MTLVSSGDLHLTGSSGAPTRSIEYECEGTYNGYSLTTAQNKASAYVGALPTSITDFYELTYSDVVIDFSDSISWWVNTAASKDGRQSTVVTGWVNGDVIDFDLDLDFVLTSGAVACTVYQFFVDSDPDIQWETIDTFTSTTSDSYVVRAWWGFPFWLRIEMDVVKAGVGYITATLTGGTYYTGYGSVIASGSTTWYVSVSGS